MENWVGRNSLDKQRINLKVLIVQSNIKTKLLKSYRVLEKKKDLEGY